MRLQKQYRVGCVYTARLNAERSYSTGNTAPYPAWYHQDIPVKIVEEHPNFYVVEVQDHLNSACIFPTVKFQPYRVTIDKWMLKTGEFELK